MFRSSDAIRRVCKVLGGNFLRAFEQAERVAKINSRQISGEGNLKKIK
ncbi:MAG: hypothetical protein ACR2HG_06385 [Pyrinomonadaceae bacterium]